MSHINFELMMEQEPAFKEYAKEVCLQMVLTDKKSMEGFMSTVLSFYNIGMSMEQVSQWLKEMKRFGEMGDNL